MSAQPRLEPVTEPAVHDAHAVPLLYCTGWVMMFLFGMMALTGALLSFYYVPSVAPSTTLDGRELGAAQLMREYTWLGMRYRAGEIIALPLAASGDSLDAPTALRAFVTAVVDTSTQRIVRPSAAWTSVDATISRGAELGGVIRSLHHYCGSLLIASILLFVAALLTHLRPGRGVDLRNGMRTWTAIIALLLLTLTAAFTGSVLPWNAHAYAAARIATSFVEESVPVIGSSLAEIVRGGGDVAQSALTRAHALHTVVLPLALTLLVCWMGVRMRRRTDRLYPTRYTSERREWLLLGGAMVLLTIGTVIDRAMTPDSALVAVGLVLFCVSAASIATRLVSPRDTEQVTTEITNANRAAPAADAASPPDVVIRSRTHRYSYLLACLLLFGIVSTISLIAPARPRGVDNFPIDMLASEVAMPDARPEWYLMWAYTSISTLSAPTAFGIIVAILIAVILLPLTIRAITSARSARRDRS